MPWLSSPAGQRGSYQSRTEIRYYNEHYTNHRRPHLGCPLTSFCPCVWHGNFLPVIGWSDQRRKSNYASFQCLQALGYQSLGFTVWVLSYLVIIILASIILLAMLGRKPEAAKTSMPLLSPGMIVFFIIVFGFFALYFLLPIIAAVACALGRDFRYPLLGDRLARYLGYDPAQKSEEQVWLNEDHEFRWVAAMGHFSILIMLWGMLAPLTAWILQGKAHFFLKFQSIQTLVYQACHNRHLFCRVGFLYLFGILLLACQHGSHWRDQTSIHPWGSSVLLFSACSY